MPLPMARPWKHPKTGVYHLRKRVPADLVELVGKEIEKASLGTKDPAEARVRHFAAIIALEERWAGLRKGRRSLTNRQVQALAGDIYRARVAEHEDDPGAPAVWRRLAEADSRLETLRRATAGRPSALRLATGWSEAEAVIRSRHGDAAEELIASKGLIVAEADRRRIVLAAAEATGLANRSLLRKASGDYSPDPTAERFPASLSEATPLKFDALWAEYRRVAEPSPKTQKRWLPVLRRFVRFCGTDDMRRVTKTDVIRWRDKMLEPGSGKAPITVRDVYLAAPKALFGFAVEHSRMGANPVAGVTVRVRKRITLRDPDFTPEEANLILSASLAPQNDLSSRELKAARRWVPWLCAYTGARVNEMTQLRKEDVRLSQLLWVVHITPEAGTTKNRAAREVPIHDHLLEQGFLDFVASMPKGPLFYSASRTRGGKAENPPSVRMGQKLAEWVRAVGVTDRKVQPNHGWRHLFKTVGRTVGMDAVKLDYIQGHAPDTEGKKYGRIRPLALKPEIDKIPRYEVVAAPMVDRRRKPKGTRQPTGGDDLKNGGPER